MIADFFDFARERHAIYRKRATKEPAPWTDDPILQQYRFTNVFRELDATTIWFREKVRDPLRATPEVLLATVVFRLFNRITTGEAIFCQGVLDIESGSKTAWELFLTKGDTRWLKRAILSYCGDDGPYVTGSYIIKTPDGLDKLDGVLRIIEWFVERRTPPADAQWLEVANSMLEHPGLTTLEKAWDWLTTFPFIGDFTAYEIVTDLRHTDLLCRAPDIMTWANPGPGCRRGLNVVMGRDADGNVSRGQMLGEMHNILLESMDRHSWPGNWPAWEMRDVEHTLCEYFKYHRVRSGGQPPRQRFRNG
jgi:hypothetical protein